MKVTLSLLIVTLLLLPGKSFSQEDQKPKEQKSFEEKGYGSFYTAFGLMYFQKLDGLNDRARMAGLPTISNNMSSLRVGGYRAFKDRFILGGEMDMMFDFDEESNERMFTLRNSLLVFFGYKVFERPYMKLYPLVGFGFDGMLVTYFDKDLPEQDFNQFLDNPSADGAVVNAAPVFELAASADFKTRKNNARSPLVGVRFGYSFAPEFEWISLANNLTNAPEDKLGGLFLKVLIGFINNDKIKADAEK